MSFYARFSGDEPSGTVVVTLVASETGPRAFISEVIDPDDPAAQSVEQSEEMGVEEALALAENKRSNIAGRARVVIAFGPGGAWNPEWGELA